MSSAKNVIPSAHIYTMLEEIFESSIVEADMSELISDLGELYDSFNGQGFEESYRKVLLYILSESKRSTDVAKLLRFIAESTVTLDNKFKTAAAKKGNKEDVDDVVHPLLKYLFKTLMSWSEASSFTVRFRSCQLLYIILSYIQDHGMGEIDMEVYENIGNLIDSRRLDVSSNVRAHSVLLSKFFQDPSVVNDPVIAALCWQMQYDPNSRVRQNVVSCIAACEETIMPIANRFLHDKHPGVRNAALLHICKRIGPRSFTQVQRVLILHKCFTDSSDVIRHNAEQKLIPVWFRACGDKLLTFFKILRVSHESLDNLPFIKELTNILLKFVKISQIVEEIELDLSCCLPKLPLSGEKVFLWRRLFTHANKDVRLTKFIPSLDNLIPFVLKCFDDCSSDEVEVCVFTELILFLMDVMDSRGIQKCDEVFPMALNLMRHPYVPCELMPYLVTLYITFSPKEKYQVHKDILEVIEDLQKLMQFTEGHEKNILLKCFAIASQILTEESSLTPSILSIKDKLIIHHLNSEDCDVKKCATSVLTLYCLLDAKEAKLSWSIFENAIQMDSGPLRNTLFEGLFDILHCHGKEIFADFINDGQEKLDETLEDVLKCFGEEESESEIIIKGILKLYLAHKISSPSFLANVIVLYFHPEDYTSAQCDLEKFFLQFSESKAGTECIVKAFLTVVDNLFEASKKSPLHEINIKQVAVQLLEFSKLFEKRKNSLEESFQNLLIVKLCKKFLKKPWKLSAADLYSICSQIIPKEFDTLLNLKEYVLQIIESLQSSIFQQKNPYSKRSIKNFSCYLKKIQQALKTAPLNSKTKTDSSINRKLQFVSSSSPGSTIDTLTKNIDIEVVHSPLRADISSSDNTDLRSSVDLESLMESKIESPKVSIPCADESPFKLPQATPRKTPGRNRLPPPCAEESPFKLPQPTPRKTPGRNRLPPPCTDESPSKLPQPTPQKTPGRSRLSRKAQAPSEKKILPDNTFKTPGPQKNNSRKRQLEIDLMKTC